MKNCPQCNAGNADDARFCTTCGRPFGSAAPSAPFAPAPQPVGSQPVEPHPVGSQTTATPTEPPQPLPVLIENRSPMTKQTLRDIYQLKKLAVWLIVLGVLLFLFWILQIKLSDSKSPFLLIFGIIVAAFGIFLFFYEKKFLNSNKMFTDNACQVCLFDERGFRTISFEGNMQTGDSYLTYDKITSVYRQKEYIFIRLGAIILILNRSCFTYGTEYDLKNLLLAKCPPKVVRLK